MFDHNRFGNRLDAGEQLATRLSEYRGRRPVILGIPRGGVPLARIVADRLGGELDVVLVHKFGTLFDPEFALGAVDENGWVHVMPYAKTYVAEEDDIRLEQARQIERLKARRAQYTPYRPPVEVKGRIAIVVDDGIATGATMIAALHAVRAREPAELVCAVPVAARQSLEQLKSLADKIVCVHAPDDLGSISHFYRDFRAVDDDEVVRMLAQAGPAGERHGHP